MALMAKRVRENDTRNVVDKIRNTAMTGRTKTRGLEPFPVAGKSVALRATVRSLIVQIEGTRSMSSREVPIPFDEIHADSEVYDMTEGREGKLVIHEWLAIKEGLPRAEK